MAPRTAPEPLPAVPLPPEGTILWGDMRITVKKVANFAQVSTGVHKITVDSGAIHGILIVRPRRVGDRIALPGWSGSKTLKKALIDARVPASRRDRLPVFEAGGRVAAVWGLGADRAFLPTPGAEALEITAETIE